MADYRLSVSVISRAAGKSSVASAAYRSGDRFVDERTGQIHDYTRKGGVSHSEIMAPEQTPDWMRDRAQLWNAVEKIEKRKDAQLSREIQLSLPHELTADQRRDLVRGFVADQFVSRGMIADIAIHAPNEKGDERNHHAHIMLTMRELTADGFGKKDRSWNDKALLENWRERWAHVQNRELEHHSHESRVDHRSFEAQGIDREPTHHLGYVANQMERNGKPSRIGNENRKIVTSNRERAENWQKLSAVDREKSRVDSWAHQKREEIKAAQELKGLDLSQKHDRQTSRLEADLEKRNGTLKATLKAEIQTIDRKLESKGVKKVLRDVFGKNRTDRQTREDMHKTLAGVEKRENEERRTLEKRQDLERKRQAERQERRRSTYDKSVERLKDQRERQGWVKTALERKERNKAHRAAKPSPASNHARPTSKAPQQATQPQKSPDHAKPTFTTTTEPVKKIDSPGLDDKKNTTDTKLDKHKGKAARPWQRSSLSNDNDNSRPWMRQDVTRDRTPEPPKGGGGKK